MANVVIFLFAVVVCVVIMVLALFCLLLKAEKDDHRFDDPDQYFSSSYAEKPQVPRNSKLARPRKRVLTTSTRR
jgi:hypothetical protein